MLVVQQYTECGMSEIVKHCGSRNDQIHFQLTLSMIQSSNPIETTAPTTSEVPIRSVQCVGMSNTVT